MKITNKKEETKRKQSPNTTIGRSLGIKPKSLKDYLNKKGIEKVGGYRDDIYTM